MKEVRFVEYISCKKCALIFQHAGKERKSKLINERKNLPRCQGCEKITLNKNSCS